MNIRVSKKEMVFLSLRTLKNWLIDISKKGSPKMSVLVTIKSPPLNGFIFFFSFLILYIARFQLLEKISLFIDFVGN